MVHGGYGDVGTRCIVGGIYGMFSRLIRPGIKKLAQKAGNLAPAVEIGGEAASVGVAYAVAGLCKEGGRRLGEILTQIPLLGANNVVASAVQIGIASYLGDRLGALLVPEKDAVTAQSNNSDSVFLSNMCVMCNTQFVIGDGHTVAAFNCGHACLCGAGQGAPAGASCATIYLRERLDCPLCRAENVHIMHEIRV